MVFLLAAVVLIGILIYFRANLLAGTGILVLLSGLWVFTGKNSTTAEWIVLLLLLSAAVFINVPGLRRAFLIKPLFLLFRRMMPPISRTEREALEAGTVWWDGELFSGNPDWGKLFAMPKPELSEEEQSFLDGPVEELCRMLDDYRIVAVERDLSPEIWRFIKERLFWGMIIPKQYGGLGFSALAQSQVIVKIASRSITAAVTVMVPNSLGPAELLLRYGTEEQKRHYLPRLARGEEIPCLALTSPEAGSDAASIPDTGIVCRGVFKGEKILGIKLNWEKRYITLGPIATILGLAFRLRDPEHLLGNDVEPGITLALIPTGTPGITIGSRHNPLGVPFQNGPNRGEDVFIPVEWIVGGKSGAGQGWQMIMESLAAGRSISMPALSTGVGKFTARVVGAYAKIRRQFRISIGHFEGIEEVLARIAGSLYRMDAARTLTAGAVDLGERPSVISAIIKYHCTEQMRKVANDGMDVLGGSGICLGPRNMLGRIYQAAPIGITVEGANILTRSMIIFGQGAIRCHPYMLKEMRSVTNPDTQKGLEDFDGLLRQHIAFVFRNAARSLAFGLTGGRLAKAPASHARRYYQIATRFSTAFALTTDLILMMLGGELKRKERISARLADILTHLYLISALLKQFKDRQEPLDELPLLLWACEESAHEIRIGFEELFENLPFRPAAWFLRLMIFPLGRGFARPDDRLGGRIAGILMEPAALRDRLTAGMFNPTDLSDPLGRLEDALNKATAAENAEQKLRNAVKTGRLQRQDEESLLEMGVSAGILSSEEADSVRQASAARREVIKVDDFPEI
ncbi:MAG TPA: acyl-CoA dehydrogenase [Acidobacteriota bacterium]|nr:acyl-CoA dehydrogenase [Acidobacteriota bacterium]